MGGRPGSPRGVREPSGEATCRRWTLVSTQATSRSSRSTRSWPARAGGVCDGTWTERQGKAAGTGSPSDPVDGQASSPTCLPPAVGLFGKIGAWNTGNDASMESVLGYLRSQHGEAVVDAMCTGPERVTELYGVPAIPLFWQQRYEDRVSGAASVALKVLGKGIDAFRTAAWVRRHDVVIVPGAGVLEASLPLWPWGFPYALFLLCASGRVFRTKVALVSVGAAAIRQPVTRWLSNTAARLAFYRSYRDAGAREAMRRAWSERRPRPRLPRSRLRPADTVGRPRHLPYPRPIPTTRTSWASASWPTTAPTMIADTQIRSTPHTWTR